MLHLGNECYVERQRVIAILSAEGNGMKRLRDEKTQQRKLIDCTRGQGMEAMILADDGTLFLSSSTITVLWLECDKYE